MSGFARSARARSTSTPDEHGPPEEKEDHLSGEDVREGLPAVISVKPARPQFGARRRPRSATTAWTFRPSRSSHTGLGEFLERTQARSAAVIMKSVRPARPGAASKASDLTRRKSAARELKRFPGKPRCSVKDSDRPSCSWSRRFRRRTPPSRVGDRNTQGGSLPLRARS